MSSPVSPQIERLLAALPLAAAPTPDDLAEALERLPDVGSLPSPWDVWILFGLARLQVRQEWLLSVICDHLHVDVTDRGRLIVPEDVPGAGPVPGLPGWSYCFEEGRCQLRDAVSWECIDVEFEDDTADCFNVHLCARYFRSIYQGDVAACRLNELHGSGPIDLAIVDLQEAGALIEVYGTEQFRLASAVRAAIPAIDAVVRASVHERRDWIAACLGDWPWALKETHPALRARLAERAGRCRTLRRERLERALAHEATALYGLLGLADLEVDDLRERLLAGLGSPSLATVEVALGLVRRRWEDAFADPVLALMQSLDPRGRDRSSELFMSCACVLVRHGHHVDTVAARLVEAGMPLDGETLAHALVHRAPSALELVRLGLRARDVESRSSTAALLAFIDSPWARRELAAVLAECDGFTLTYECRVALRTSADPGARALVDDWERLHPRAQDSEPAKFHWEHHIVATKHRMFARGLKTLRESLINPVCAQS